MVSKSPANQESYTRVIIESLTDEHIGEIQVFKPDPPRYLISNKEKSHYKSLVRNDLYRITKGKLPIHDLWGKIVDILFDGHSEFLFSLFYQLIPNYYNREFLPLLTKTNVDCADFHVISQLFQTNLLVFKDKCFQCNAFLYSMAKGRKTMVIVQQPEKYFTMVNKIRRIAESHMFELVLEEQDSVSGFQFNTDQYLTHLDKYDDLSNFLGTIEESKSVQYSYFYRGFHQLQQEHPSYPTYKAWIALWSNHKSLAKVPDSWIPSRADDSIYLKDLILLLTKIALSFSGEGVLIFKGNYYCILPRTSNLQITICELDERSHRLKAPIPVLSSDCLSTYGRKSLSYLLDHYSDFIVR